MAPINQITIKAVKATLQKNIKGAVDDVAEAVTSITKPNSKPLIDIKSVSKPNNKVTIKTPTQQTFEKGVGTDILAEQNRTMLVNHRNATSQVNSARANPASNPKSISIKGATAQPEFTRKFAELCNKNHGEITPEDIAELQKVFRKETGLTLHCFGNIRDFNKTLSAIADEVKNGKFPKEIKHIMIGHGSGNVATKNWVTSEGSVLKYINTNKKMEKGDLVLVACCEDGLGTWSPDFPGRGLPVELVPCGRFKNDAGRGPAKIVRRGEEIICGDYSLTDGLKIYDN